MSSPSDTSNSGPNPQAQQDWSKKLVGKTYVEGDVATTDENTFTKASLPQPSRVCKPGGLFTMDYNTERLNVHVDDKNVVTHVSLG